MHSEILTKTKYLFSHRISNKANKSVLFITHYSMLYGANLSMMNLVEDLSKRGFRIHVICPSFGNLIHALQNSGINNAIVSFRPDTISLRGGKLKTFLRKQKHILLNKRINKRASVAIARYIIANEISIVHTNSICTTVGALAAFKTRRPHVWHIRECLEIFYNDTVPLTMLRSKMYSYTKKFLAISNAVKEYDSYHVIPPSKITVVYNGLPQILPENISDKTSGKFIFAIVGVLQEGKRVKDAITAFSMVQGKINGPSELWIIGGTYPEDDKIELIKLKSLVNKLNIDDSVKFWGYQKNIHPLLNQAHCGLLCSVFESFGRVLIEYMQHKMLVITNDAGASKEIINDGVNGLIYRSMSIENLAEKMIFAATHQIELEAIINEGYRKATESFTIENCTNKIVHIYNDILS